jgi:TRAP-type transport system small permease protein
MFTRFNAFLAKYCMIVAVVGLYAIVAAVVFQVFGRYVMNDTPTWAESLTLVLILYVALFGAAVGVRDAGHIGMESLLALIPERWRRWLELAIHVLVGIFGSLMVAGGWGLMEGVLTYKIPTLGISEGWHYAPLILSGALIVLFSIEHIIAKLQRKEVVPSWL